MGAFSLRLSGTPQPGFTNSLCDHLAWDEHEPPQCEARRPAPHPACEAPLLGGRHSHPGGHRGSRLDPSRQEAAGCGRSPEGGRQALRRSDGGAPSQSSWFKSAHGLSAACPPPKGLGLPDCGASSGRQAAHLSTPVERSALASALRPPLLSTGRRPRLQPSPGRAPGTYLCRWRGPVRS